MTRQESRGVRVGEWEWQVWSSVLISWNVCGTSHTHAHTYTHTHTLALALALSFAIALTPTF